MDQTGQNLILSVYEGDALSVCLSLSLTTAEFSFSSSSSSCLICSLRIVSEEPYFFKQKNCC